MMSAPLRHRRRLIVACYPRAAFKADIASLRNTERHPFARKGQELNVKTRSALLFGQASQAPFNLKMS